MILSHESAAEAQAILEDTIRLCLDFKLRDRVYGERINGDWQYKDLPIEGMPLKPLLEEFARLLPYCVNFSSKQFMGFPDSGNAVAAMVGAVFGELLQQNLINHSFCSPIATYLEIDVIRWLRQVVGYTTPDVNTIYDIGGIITSSGTMSNATAMLFVRENKVISNGTNVKYKVLIPDNIGHYSIGSSLFWIGNGLECLSVPTQNNKYNKIALDETLRRYKGRVACVVCYACDSRSMSVDDLKGVYSLVKSIDDTIWLHADACHGFSLGFSDKLKDILEGIEEYDSISMDPHKVLMTPYVISALLLKEPKHIAKIMSKSDLIMQEPLSLGQTTPFIGSKNWNSLKLWFLIKNLGKNGLGRIVERRVELINYIYHRMSICDKFVVLNRPEYNSLMFMYAGSLSKNDVVKLNRLNQALYRYILDQGDYYIHQFPFKDTDGIVCKNAILYPLRLITANPNLDETDLDEFWDYILSAAKLIEDETVNR